MAFSIVFQSYRADVKVVMIGCTRNGTSFTTEKNSKYSGTKIKTAGLEIHHLSSYL